MVDFCSAMISISKKTSKKQQLMLAILSGNCQRMQDSITTDQNQQSFSETMGHTSLNVEDSS